MERRRQRLGTKRGLGVGNSCGHARATTQLLLKTGHRSGGQSPRNLKWWPAKEEKKATGESNVGIRPFNEEAPPLLKGPSRAVTAARSSSLFFFPFYHNRTRVMASARGLFEQPNSNVTILRVAFFSSFAGHHFRFRGSNHRSKRKSKSKSKTKSRRKEKAQEREH